MPRYRTTNPGWWPLAALLALGSPLSFAKDADAPGALSYGRGGCGKLEGGVALPCSGENFEAFTSAACVAGRIYLHPLAQATVVDAYAELASTVPERRWQYGEMGLREGGKLWPHRTHQNGLSADFFVPVTDRAGLPRTLPINPANKFGYDLEFDRNGTNGDLKVDWRALANHLLALEKAGRAHNVRIERVILTPDFHAELFEAAPEVRQLAGKFMKKEAWVRHDEHFHVDFDIPRSHRRSLACGRGK